MEKLNIAELLKDCPSGTKLYSPLCGECRYQGLEKRYNEKYTKIVVKTEKDSEIWFNEYGKYFNDFTMDECLIFPSKENRDWSTFQRPFKDGDIVATKNGLFIGIIKARNDELYFETYCAINNRGSLTINTNYYFDRHATEEEKQKLFDAIKANGYKWNDKTKTLEKLPKFKVGDRVKHISAYTSGIVVKVDDKGYCIDYPKGEGVCYISFKLEKDYELVPNKFDITTLKPFDKVLVRDNNEQKWTIDMFSFYDKTLIYPFICIGHYVNQCIPYEGNEHLLGTTNDCDEYFKTWK